MTNFIVDLMLIHLSINGRMGESSKHKTCE